MHSFFFIIRATESFCSRPFKSSPFGRYLLTVHKTLRPFFITFEGFRTMHPVCNFMEMRKEWKTIKTCMRVVNSANRTSKHPRKSLCHKQTICHAYLKCLHSFRILAIFVEMEISHECRMLIEFSAPFFKVERLPISIIFLKTTSLPLLYPFSSLF